MELSLMLIFLVNLSFRALVDCRNLKERSPSYKCPSFPKLFPDDSRSSSESQSDELENYLNRSSGHHQQIGCRTINRKNSPATEANTTTDLPDIIDNDKNTSTTVQADLPTGGENVTAADALTGLEGGNATAVDKSSGLDRGNVTAAETLSTTETIGVMTADEAEGAQTTTDENTGGFHYETDENTGGTAVSAMYHYNTTCTDTECVTVVSSANKADVTLRMRRPSFSIVKNQRTDPANQGNRDKGDHSSNKENMSGGKHSSDNSQTSSQTTILISSQTQSFSNTVESFPTTSQSWTSQSQSSASSQMSSHTQSFSTTKDSFSTTSQSWTIQTPKPAEGARPPVAGYGGGKPTGGGRPAGGGYIGARPAAGDSISDAIVYPEPPATTQKPTTQVPPERKGLPIQIPTPPDCGNFNSTIDRIVNGAPAWAGKWPWMVAYGYQLGPNEKVTWMCGGSLVTAKSSITAAHCLDHPSAKLSKARFGEFMLDDDDDGAVTMDVSYGLRHPLYNKREYSNDIAIVVLKEAIIFTHMIKPICLPFGKNLRKETFKDMNPFIAGWGNLDFRLEGNGMLYDAQIPVVPNEDCAAKYAERRRIVTKSQICAGGTGKDSCQGDSGGPLMVPHNQSFYVIGVVSYGFRCGLIGYPGVFTRITSYLDWLQQNLT